MRIRPFSKTTVFAVCWSLLAELVAVNPMQAQGVTQTPGTLHIIVSPETEDAINNIKLRTPREVIVRVEDENHKPVGAALVTFALPDQGASGTFVGGTRFVQVTTDVKGEAVAHGLQPNGVAGKFQIRVTASADGNRGEAVINQSNFMPSAPVGPGLSARTWIIIGSVAAGAAVAAGLAASRGGPGTTITYGGSTVGAPR